MVELENEDKLLKNELKCMLQALEAAGKSNLLVSGDTLLQSIVEAAARIFQAAAASILLLNEAEDSLEFKVATGAANRDLVGTRIPLNQGIAGYVVMTGQPIAISNVQQDARFNREFAQSTGYVPRSILAMPLTSAERIMGVMEVLDKLDAPSFGMHDMELMGIFARQAALAIEMMKGMENLGDAMTAGLRRLAQTAGVDPGSPLLAGLEEGAHAAQRNELLELGAMLHDFTRLGKEERTTGLKILAAFSEYSQSKQRLSRAGNRR